MRFEVVKRVRESWRGLIDLIDVTRVDITKVDVLKNSHEGSGTQESSRGFTRVHERWLMRVDILTRVDIVHESWRWHTHEGTRGYMRVDVVKMYREVSRDLYSRGYARVDLGNCQYINMTTKAATLVYPLDYVYPRVPSWTLLSTSTLMKPRELSWVHQPSCTLVKGPEYVNPHEPSWVLQPSWNYVKPHNPSWILLDFFSPSPSPCGLEWSLKVTCDPLQWMKKWKMKKYENTK